MCGRYALYGPYDLGDPRIVEGWVEHIRDPLAGIARYNMAPSQSLPVLRLHEGAPRIEPMRWGLLPHWAKDTRVGRSRQPASRGTSASMHVGYTSINARIEGVTEKPAFRDAWKRGQRCLVPATGWYEWRELAPKKKQPYFFRSAEGLNPMMFAGLWSRWTNPDDGMPIDSYAILTGEARGVVAELHDRQPMVLAPDAWAAWLEAAVPEALAMLQPAPLPVRYHPVGAAVGNVRNDDPRLVDEVPAPTAEPAQGTWDFCAGDAGKPAP